MSFSSGRTSNLIHCFLGFRQVVIDLCRFLFLTARSRRALAAENLCLRKQLALFQGREIRPRRATNATRLLRVFLARLFDRRSALVIVKP